MQTDVINGHTIDRRLAPERFSSSIALASNSERQ
jgi:hypothetical protein